MLRDIPRSRGHRDVGPSRALGYGQGATKPENKAYRPLVEFIKSVSEAHTTSRMRGGGRTRAPFCRMQSHRLKRRSCLGNGPKKVCAGRVIGAHFATRACVSHRVGTGLCDGAGSLRGGELPIWQKKGCHLRTI